MMLTLYHHPTAVCAAKVRVVLAEKQLSWDGRIVDQTAPAPGPESLLGADPAR